MRPGYNMRKIDNIKTLWKQINSKTKFIIEFSKSINRSTNTLHNHWFARFWAIPKPLEDETIYYMQNYIMNQNNNIHN